VAFLKISGLDAAKPIKSLGAEVGLPVGCPVGCPVGLVGVDVGCMEG
jgi:hypothetical protein